jgi:FAD/FMN-containing dehydrogenase
MRGDGQEPLRFEPAEEQWEAVEALIRTLDPTELAIPRPILERLPPRPFRYPPHQELFARNTGLVFDAIAPAAAAADMTLSFLFHPERAARMVQQKALQPDLPGLTDVIDRVVENVFGVRFRDGYDTELNHVVERALVDRIMMLAAQAPMAQVRAESAMALRLLRQRVLAGRGTPEPAQDAHYDLLCEDIRRFLERPLQPITAPSAPSAPPGSPIGEPGMRWIGWDRSLSTNLWGSYDWWWWE